MEKKEKIKEFWKNNKYTILVLVFAFLSIIYTTGSVQQHTQEVNEWWLNEIEQCQCVCSNLGIGINESQPTYSFFTTTNKLDGVDFE